jgi:hypothetical protein
MSERKINLVEILNKKIDWEIYENRFPGTAATIKEAILEFGEQLLELAAENAYVQDWYMDGKLVGKAVNKLSILEAIKQVE